VEAWPLSLAPARFSDAEAIAEISRVRIEHGLGWRWTAARIQKTIRDPSTEVVVGRSGQPGGSSELVGFGILQVISHARPDVELEEAHLLLLGVSEAWSRRGVGRRIMHFLEAEARMAGVGSVMLEVRATNEAARAFYRAFGYREVARLAGYYQGHEDAVRMMSRLNDPR
jgi:ribosomal-protein-alanine N-acetyltransferase